MAERPFRDWAEENLSKKKLSDSGLINPDLVNKIWNQHLSGKIDTSSKLSVNINVSSPGTIQLVNFLKKIVLI